MGFAGISGHFFGFQSVPAFYEDWFPNASMWQYPSAVPDV
jgi:hypothetical protein